MSAAVFTSTEGAIAELALVFLLWGRSGLFGGRIARRGGGCGSHVNRWCGNEYGTTALLSTVSTGRRDVVSVVQHAHTVSGGDLVTGWSQFGV